MKATIPEATQLMEIYLQSQLVPMIKGSPGIGKSEIVHELAKRYNLKLIDLRLAQCDPVDLMGFPKVADNKGTYVPMVTFPVEGDPIPDGYSGWLLFLDEINSADTDVQAAAYKLILDRKVGQHSLHKNVAVVAAGNLATDGAIVQDMSTALQSRLAHIELEVNSLAWLDWANAQQFDPRITSYLSLASGNLHNFDPNHSDNTYPCPRTWAFTNRVIKNMPSTHPMFLKSVAGLISEGTAREFQTYCEMYDEIPNIHKLVTNPTGIPMPEEPSVLWALTGAISAGATVENCATLIKFIKRMPAEFQAMTLRQMCNRNPALAELPAYSDWVQESAHLLF